MNLTNTSVRYKTKGVVFVFDILMIICALLFLSIECNDYINTKADSAEISSLKPTIVYSNNSLDSTSIFKIDGSTRLLSRSDRVGIHATSAHSRFSYNKHLFNSQKGIFSVWLMPLGDLTALVNYPGMARDNEFYNIFPVVTDHANVCDVWSANFSFYINKVWHSGITAKFVKENGNDNYSHASVAANHSEFEKYHWYQLMLSWDFQKNEMVMYIKGVKVGSHDTTAEKLNVSFLKPNDLETFYVQGYTVGPKLTDEGLFAETSEFEGV
ncbi:hypothetical protein [uncultured Sunxiuqinia sp.]|uniref:hypothetical protein n=1 Tax=uncultured Sunxiuqinia sp. TaxID=1573825 RepID=UPI002AA66E09|nr:hypothetical protein [uncultured Sunxiuqinia sp.]